MTEDDELLIPGHTVHDGRVYCGATRTRKAGEVDQSDEWQAPLDPRYVPPREPTVPGGAFLAALQAKMRGQAGFLESNQ